MSPLFWIWIVNLSVVSPTVIFPGALTLVCVLVTASVTELTVTLWLAVASALPAVWTVTLFVTEPVTPAATFTDIDKVVVLFGPGDAARMDVPVHVTCWLEPTVVVEH